MNVIDVLPPENTFCGAPGGSKKRVLENLSHFIAERMNNVDADDLYHLLLDRERLGSTGIGDGVAIPHCRMPGCNKITAALLKLEDPVDFDAIDNLPVDLVFALIVPEEQNDNHLQVLSSIAQLLQHESIRQQMRQATSNEILYQTVSVNQAA